MKKIFLTVVLLCSTYNYSQETRNDNNVFDESAQSSANRFSGDNLTVGKGGNEAAREPGEPGDPPAPTINAYIPFLAVIGIGMMVYFGRKKQLLIKYY